MDLKKTFAFNKPWVLFLKSINMYNIFYRLFYIKYIEKKHILYAKKNIKYLKYNPLISIVLPVYKVDVNILGACINSVVNQIYENWELCIVDDCSQSRDIKKTIEKYRRNYSNKIKVIYKNKNENISKATNDAIYMSEGEYIVLLDNDDIILEHCLYEIVNAINSNKKVELIYSDEDKLVDNYRMYPFFKPDWNTKKILIDNYVSHVSVYKKEIFNEIGYFDSLYDGSQDWEFLLRFSVKNRCVAHIKKILYCWRMTDSSTSKNIKNKPMSYIARQKIIENINRGIYEKNNRVKK